jgi:hypothetical protein
MTSYTFDIIAYLTQKLKGIGVSESNIRHYFDDENIKNYDNTPIGLIIIEGERYETSFTNNQFQRKTGDGEVSIGKEVVTVTAPFTVSIGDEGYDKVAEHKDKFIQSFDKQSFNSSNDTPIRVTFEGGTYVSFEKQSGNLKGVAVYLNFHYSIYNIKQIQSVYNPQSSFEIEM